MKTRWKVSQGSQVGPYHERQGVENQDAHGVLIHDDFIALAVADGAGSLKDSALGAQLAVEVSLEELSRANHSHGLDLAVELAIENARTALLSHPLSSTLGCTLAVALLVGEQWAVGVVGDSFVVVKDSESNFEVVTSPPEEYANITKLLTSEDFMVHFASGEVTTGLALSTDGLAHVGLTNEGPHGGFWAPIFEWGSQPGGLIVEDFFSYLGQNGELVDDTTLVVASPTALPNFLEG